ncbi:MAG: triphosphoribosyl-dephospho-CoA synthase [Spirochaetota bacterium]
MSAVSASPVWNPVSMPEPGLTIGHLATRAAGIAVRALLREAEAGPKPGLVDRVGPGVHTDMDISHFRLSAAVLKPFFASITLESALFMAGITQTRQDEADDSAGLAETLRNLGLEAESAMLAATGGVNTHKGAIWTIGLLCAAIGARMGSRSKAITGFPQPPAPDLFNAEAVCAQAAVLAQAILTAGGIPGTAIRTIPLPGVTTKGLAARQAYGLRTARDEALEGFPSIRAGALSLARSLRNSTVPEDGKVISVLLAVMRRADDTCIVARGGLPALRMAQSSASQVLDCGGPHSKAGSILYRTMVADFKEGFLSPGGSADLCAATLFLAEMEAEGWPQENR